MKKGFTLIELLIVIVIIALLAAVIFVALDPVRRFAEARNSRRWNDVNSLLTAIHESVVDNLGALPTGLTGGAAGTPKNQLGTAALACGTTNNGTACGAAVACINLTTPLAAYMASIPTDPRGGTAAKTGYAVTVTTVESPVGSGTYSMLVTVDACDAERGVTISVTR